MTNTQFRKRALISSVAMLLVALVALGSATFAWFSADPNAHTSGLTLKANSSTGLLIQSETEKSVDTNWWTHTAVLNAASKTGNAMVGGAAVAIGAASQDASTGTNRGIYTVDAAADDAYNADPAKAVTASTKPNHYEEKLYLKVTGAASANVQLSKVTMTVGDTNLAKALRVAVLKADGTVLGIFKPAAGSNNKYLLKTASTYNASGVVSSANYTAKDSGSAQTIALGSIGNNGEDYVTVRVYLDGEDEQVYSLNIAQVDLSSIMSSLVLDFEIPA